MYAIAHPGRIAPGYSIRRSARHAWAIPFPVAGVPRERRTMISRKL